MSGNANLSPGFFCCFRSSTQKMLLLGSNVFFQDKDAIPSHVMVRDNSENLHECDILTYTYSDKDGSHAAASLYCGLNDNTPSFTVPLSSIPKE